MTAGVAAAEVTFSGTANFGYNDTDATTGASVGAAFSDIDLKHRIFTRAEQRLHSRRFF